MALDFIPFVAAFAGTVFIQDVPSPSTFTSKEKPVASHKVRNEKSLANDAEIQPLSKLDSERAADDLWKARSAEVKKTRAAEVDARVITHGDKTMKFFYKTYGQKPHDGHSLFLSLHGGGNAEPDINDQQYENQKRLYKPEEGVYLAPRAPTNTSDLWHQFHIDRLFERLIEDMVVFEGVNPDRVYLMGYSAGGDGVYQVAPRMADRLAAAAMMAGHPNEASPLGLRNLPFAIHVGANDSEYDRNNVARAWGDKLAKLRANDEQGYVHICEIHPNRGHWMHREDASAVPWMAKFRRNATPLKVVWYQDDVTHDRFYWLAVPDGKAKKGALAIVAIQGQNVLIEEAKNIETLILRFDDRLLDLDQPIHVRMNGQTLFTGKLPRTLATLKKTLEGPGDRRLMFCSEIAVVIAK